VYFIRTPPRAQVEGGVSRCPICLLPPGELGEERDAVTTPCRHQVLRMSLTSLSSCAHLVLRMTIWGSPDCQP
jgi:hypothetical protein